MESKFVKPDWWGKAHIIPPYKEYYMGLSNSLPTAFIPKIVVPIELPELEWSIDYPDNTGDYSWINETKKIQYEK